MYGGRPEATLFTGPGLQVTTTRLIVGYQTYPIAGITHVAPFTLPANRTWPILMLFFVGFWLLGALLSLVGAPSFGTFAFFAITVGFVGLCVWWLISCKPTHGLTISTSGMQVRALTTRDLALVTQVLHALNQAIASRG